MKKSLLALIVPVLVFALLFSSCGRRSSADEAPVKGYGGDLVLSAKALSSGFELSISRQSESEGIGRQALETLVGRMNEQQSVSVDGISGATVTSLAAAEAARRALESAGLDPALYALPEEYGDVVYSELGCDVVVAGAGGAGLSAAIEAARAGADVVVIEKLGQPGGSTARSGGLIMAAGTDLQRSLLISDSPISLASYLVELSGNQADPSKCLELAEGSAGTLDFLGELGLGFKSQLYPLRVGLKPDRAHQLSDGDTSSGGLLIQPMLDACEQLGVEILTNLEVFEITIDSTGRATGLRARAANGSVLSVAAGSVVLATGGFDGNAELCKSLLGLSPALSLSGIGSDGDGLSLAGDIGAAISPRGLISELCCLSCEAEPSGGLLVTPDGRRFADESLDGFALAARLFEQGLDRCYLITDYSPEYERAVSDGMAFRGSSIFELAEQLGAPELERTFSDYQRSVADGSDSLFGKPAEHLATLGGSPLVALLFELRSYGSIGGLETGRHMEVMSPYGPIGNLYAAGELVSGEYMGIEHPGFGSSLAAALYTGREAGAAAAQNALTVD